MSEPHSRYPVAIRWTSGKEGVASSTDGLPELPVASPPSFGGPAGVWSPEHLFVLSAVACWMTTFRAIAEASNFVPLAVDAEGEGFLEKGDDRRYSIPRLTLRPRVVPHGIIVCDDYGFDTCPGARQAMDTYFADRKVPIVHLPTGQGLVIRTA